MGDTDLLFLPFHCSWCNKEVTSTSYCAPYGPRMNKDKLCFSCVHWDLESNKNDPRRVIIDGYCYGVGDKEPPRDGKGRVRGEMWGFGGRRFDIEIIATGQKFTTHNLWGGGNIPERFREKLPDNARFLNGAEKAQVGETTCWDSSDDKQDPYPSFDVTVLSVQSAK
jgi:hypothetical protein